MELLEYNAEAFCRLSSVLGQALLILKQGHANDSTMSQLAGSLGEMQREVQRLELSSVEKHIQRVKDSWFEDGTPLTANEVAELYNRLRDALEERFFIAVPPDGAELFRQKNPFFGDKVEDAFPRAAEDISEAGKCLALDRSTAAVFHLMRAMESAVGRLSLKLDIPNPDREWGKLLSDIPRKLRRCRKAADATDDLKLTRTCIMSNKRGEMTRCTQSKPTRGQKRERYSMR